ncbi:NAD(P)/FAD-dependent oxidoreductase [Streptomyces sp. NPDC050560]|uniref:NAD(P)/FAD-dependent oxidoreductase n=1 Tax=Streptomyces sp. NPDC050560 TaxID=3365630 RepID=UPI00379E06C2
MSEPTAVVIGGSLTGLLAAAALSRYADVTVVERDTLPEGPAPRRGLPQARHAHLLWSGGIGAIESVLPGFPDALVAAGGRRVPMFADLVSLSPQGPWLPRWDHPHSMLVASRDLLDATVRARVLATARVGLLEQADALGLTGDARRVTGVRVLRDGAESVLGADLVVDASGRGTRAPVWLSALGLPPVRVRTVDSGVGYATRVFRAPTGALPVVNVQADPRSGGPGRTGVILPVEGGRWVVTLSGTRGARPDDDPDAFEAFARSLRHPVIGELIAGAEPLTGVAVSRSTASLRRYYERCAHWPEGFVALGDAVATYNPLYGHGMSAAALSVVALRERVARDGLAAPGLARRVQRAAAGPVGTAWDVAVTQDSCYEGASERPPTAVERLFGAYLDRVVVAGGRSRGASLAMLDVMSMSRPPARLLTLPVLAAALRHGRRGRPAGDPPLLPHERAGTGRPGGQPPPQDG